MFFLTLSTELIVRKLKGLILRVLVNSVYFNHVALQSTHLFSIIFKKGDRVTPMFKISIKYTMIGKMKRIFNIADYFFIRTTKKTAKFGKQIRICAQSGICKVFSGTEVRNAILYRREKCLKRSTLLITSRVIPGIYPRKYLGEY